VLILKEVKVVCFDTLLQVLILKVDIDRVVAGETNEESGQQRAKIEGKDNATLEARGKQGKETQRAQSWRSDREERGMPPPAFFKKSAQTIENKGRRSKKERQEISRGGKPLKD
jgi:hypothetical protein